MSSSKNLAGNKQRSQRKRRGQQGMRLIKIWVPDVESPEFAREARCQSLAVARSKGEKDNQDFIDSISEF